MIWGFRFGDVTIKPSATESVLFAAGVGAAAYGIWHGKGIPAAGGLLIAGSVGYRLWEKAKEVEDPELMNGFFITNGALSATRGASDARKLEGLLGL